MKVSKLDLLQFVLLVFGVGMMTGVLLSYVDNGFPTSRHWAAWPVLSVLYGFLILFSVAQFFAIAESLAAVGKE